MGACEMRGKSMSTRTGKQEKEDTFIRDRIKVLNAERSWSMYQLSQYSGVSQSELSSILLHNHQPSVVILKKICRAYGLSMADFFTEQDGNDEIDGFVICIKEAEIYAVKNGGQRKFVHCVKELAIPFCRQPPDNLSGS